MVSDVALVAQFAQFGCTVVIQFLHFGEDHERIGRVASEVLDGLLKRSAGFAERSTVRGALAFPVSTFRGDAALTHGRVTDDDRRATFLRFRFDDGLTDGVGIIARDLLYVPTPCCVLSGYIFGGHFAATCGELDGVGVVEHNEVIQTQVTCQTACTLRDLLLHAAVRDEGVNGRVVDGTVALVEPFGSNRCTDSEGVTLTQRTGGVLDHALDLTLGVTRCDRTPLTEVLQVLKGELTGEA